MLGRYQSSPGCPQKRQNLCRSGRTWIRKDWSEKQPCGSQRHAATLPRWYAVALSFAIQPHPVVVALKPRGRGRRWACSHHLILPPGRLFPLRPVCLWWGWCPWDNRSNRDGQISKHRRLLREYSALAYSLSLSQAPRVGEDTASPNPLVGRFRTCVAPHLLLVPKVDNGLDFANRPNRLCTRIFPERRDLSRGPVAIVL